MRSTRNVGVLVLAMGVLAVPGWAQEVVTTERGVDRPGKNYRSFELDTADPGLCRQACLNEDTCKAYTYVNPGVQGPKARCWLKNGVPAPTKSRNCVSGVKKPDPIVEIMEQGFDRPGMNYRDFGLETADPKLCVRACFDDPKCRAFTYVKPGLKGDQARCRLKTGVPERKKSPGSISGVKKVDPIVEMLEKGVDRRGMDYRSFDLKKADPRLCAQACLDDPKCRAFTYVEPGLQGANARCWLKKGVPEAAKRKGCVSGVVPKKIAVPATLQKAPAKSKGGPKSVRP